MPQLPFVCLECHRVYKRVEVHREVLFGERAAGYCPACTVKMEARLFGRAALMTTKATVFTCKREDANFDIEAAR